MRTWIAVLGLVAAGCGVDDAAERAAALEQLRGVDAKVQRWAAQHGAPPERLSAAVREAPLDPWGAPVDYKRLGDDRYELISYGADGRAGGEGADADVSLIGRVD